MNTFHNRKFHLLNALLYVSLVLALILSAAGMETAHAAPLFDPVLPSGLNGNGPGGVGTTDGSSALELWLRPDRGVYTDNLCSVAAGNGSAVYCWADQSGNGANATQATTANRPLYYTTTAANLINGQPTIRLDGNNDYFNVPVSVIQGRTAFSFFTAFRWNAASNWQRLWDFGQSEARNGFVTARYNTSNRPRFAITTGGGTAEQQLTFSSALPTGSGQIIDVIWGPNPKTGWRNGANQALGNYTLTPNNLGTITQNYIGRSIYPDPYLNANMGEFIVFSTALNDTNRILVDNYLCSKYDVTLSANDVYTGDIPANGNFDLDVAGIGQLGGSQHTASHAAGIIVVNNTFLNANGDWLLFGHNTAANSTTTADLPSSTWGSRWSRAWYMDLTDAGTTGGTVNIIFDYSDSGLGGTPTYPVGAYRLLSRAGTSGQFTDVTTASGATVSIDGDQVQFLGVNVSPLDGLTFTLGVYTPPDLALIKAVTPASAAPGQTITYTLVFSNAGIGAATDVVITDTIPVSVTNTSVSSSGVAITETAPGYVWAVADLAPGVGGVITVTGVLSEPLAAGVFTNTAVITGTGDSNPANNASSAGLTVLNVAPVANDNGYSTAEDTSLTVAAPGVLTNDTDANGDPMSAVLVDTVPVSAGALTLNADGSLTYTPTLDFNGVVTFTYYAYDGELASNTATVTLTITPVNDAPAFTSAPVTAAIQDAPYSYAVAADDPDLAYGDALTLTAPTLPAWLALTDHGDGTATLSGTPTNADVGDHAVVLRVTDSSGLFAEQFFTITVSNVNETPVAVDDSYVIAEDTVLTVFAPGVLDNDSDVDGDTLTAMLVDTVSVGVLVLNADGSLTYTPTLDFNGVVTFTYYAYDGELASNTATVTVTVAPVNDPPTLADIPPQNTTESEPFSLTITVDDVESGADSLTVSATSSDTALVPLSNISISGAGMERTITITPTGGLTGTLWITITVSDGTDTTSKGFELTVGQQTSWRIYLPVVMQTFVHAPDLVVDSIAVGQDNVQVVIANRGSAAATGDFWVDLYVNPDPPPAGVNDIWRGRCAQGIVWGVTIDLAPGETLILSLNDLYMDVSRTTFSGVSAGDTVYVQVDSANVATTYGGVLETHEIAGQPYNNIKSITVSTTTTASVSTVNGMSSGDPIELPERP